MRLEQAPLVEALVEVRWTLQAPGGDLGIDPHYRLLLARLSDKAAARYPDYERLPAASIPEELAGHLVQHRFRHGQGGYPLIQLGPGVLTFNETTNYDPNDFRERAVGAIALLYEAHPEPSKLEIVSVQLRYINAEDFDYETYNLFDFLREKMGVAVSLPSTLFDDFDIDSSPHSLSWQSAFRTSAPPGEIVSRFITGEREGRRALIWETTVTSTGAQVGKMPTQFSQWFDDAHHIADGWFWALVAGELERKYRDG